MIIQEINRFIDATFKYRRYINISELQARIPHIQKSFLNPNTTRYEAALQLLPVVTPSIIELDKNIPIIGRENDLSTNEQSQLIQGLKNLMPWRKGPYSHFGIQIDSEWQSFYKWNRILPHLPNLKEKNVLDIGCNNGYYLFRMASQHPNLLIGIDPYPIFFYQFRAIYRYLKLKNLFYLPIGTEELGVFTKLFHVVFCMGILYHRASPIDTLKQIRQTMKKEGVLILETITYPGDDSTAFFPKDRYAKMRNVYFLPTIPCLINWLDRAGFRNCKIISTDKTTISEQRKTDWMTFESLKEYLDPNDSEKTIEGYPTPQRSILIATV